MAKKKKCPGCGSRNCKKVYGKKWKCKNCGREFVEGRSGRLLFPDFDTDFV